MPLFVSREYVFLPVLAQNGLVCSRRPPCRPSLAQKPLICSHRALFRFVLAQIAPVCSHPSSRHRRLALRGLAAGRGGELCGLSVTPCRPFFDTLGFPNTLDRADASRTLWRFRSYPLTPREFARRVPPFWPFPAGDYLRRKRSSLRRQAGRRLRGKCFADSQPDHLRHTSFDRG